MAAKSQKASETSSEEVPMPGGFVPIKDIKDPYIQSLGKFAVDEHNKQAGSHLKFQEVVRGESQIVEGVNYSLELTALDHVIVLRIYIANVFRDLDNNLYLNSFFPHVLKD